MRSFFDIGMQRSPWDLGQLPDMETAPEREERERREAAAAASPDWTQLISAGLTAGSAAFQQYTKAEIAEEQAEAKEAEAAAARARADAERARAEALRAQAEPGIPTGYLILGGLGIVGAVVAAVVLAR